MVKLISSTARTVFFSGNRRLFSAARTPGFLTTVT